MALDETPGEIVTRTRDQIRDQYLRDYALRIPTADVGPDTLPYVDASGLADAEMVLVNDAVVIGRGTVLRDSAGAWLLKIGEDEGVSPRPAVGGSGFVTVTTSSGGATILAGTEIREPKCGLRFRVTATALYTSSTAVPLTGIDTGNATNLRAGTAVTFTAPPPGVSAAATIATASDGSGLSGGRPADDDATYRALIASRRANPPAAGNDAEYQSAGKKTPGVSVEQVFTWPAVKGTGTIAVSFTLLTSASSTSRIPNATEIALAESYVKGQEPFDDGAFWCSLVAQPVTVGLAVTWATPATSWVDGDLAWPLWVSGDKVIVDGAVTPTATTCRLTTATATSTPQVGQTIGFFDAANRVFRRKKILTVVVVVATKSWTLTFDTTNNASDTSYAPVVGTAASPWADSLDTLTAPVVAYVNGLGPGEQVATLPDPGQRQRRQPTSPVKWPSVVTTRLLTGVFALSSVEDLSMLEPTTPYATTVGTPGVLAYLITLGDLCAFRKV